jgi:hypothetical protein
MCACAALAGCSVSSAFADGPVSTRPFQRLFGATMTSSRSHQLLDITAMTSEAYDNLVQPEDQNVVSAGGAAMYSMLQLGAKYGRHGRTLSISFDSVGDFRYYPALGRQVIPDYSLLSTQHIQLGRRTQVSFAENGSYQPFRTTTHILEQTFFYTDTDTPPTVEVNDYAVETRTRLYTYNATAELSTAIARATLAFGYEMRQSTGDPALDLKSERAFVRFTQPVTRHASLRLGYGERRAVLGTPSAGQRVDDHDIDVGMDVDQPISPSRRTTIRFTSGSSITSVDGIRQFHVAGSASLKHEIGRSWIAQLGYTRAVQLLEGFPAPALTDTISVTANGFLTRRVRVSTSTTGQLGTVTTATAGRFLRYDESAMLSIDLTRNASFTARYVAQQYDPRSLGAVALPLSQRSRGQGVRIGMTFWMDALR